MKLTKAQKAEHARKARWVVELAGIKDKAVKGFIIRQVENIAMMSFYDGQLALLDEQIKGSKKGGKHV